MCQDMAGSSYVKKIRRLKRKIRLQASEHTQDIEKYKAMIAEMKLRERHRELVFYAALHHICEYNMDGSMALLWIKKSRMVWILHIMIKTIKIFQNMIYYNFL